MMTVREAIDVMEKDKACATKAMACIDEKKACSSCEIYVDPYDIDEAHETAFRLMQAWEKAKDDIRKACGCTTALDIMERYEKEEQIEPEKVTCFSCQFRIGNRCVSSAWKKFDQPVPHIIGHDLSEPILCDYWKAEEGGLRGGKV